MSWNLPLSCLVSDIFLIYFVIQISLSGHFKYTESKNTGLSEFKINKLKKNTEIFHPRKIWAKSPDVHLWDFVAVNITICQETQIGG